MASSVWLLKLLPKRRADLAFKLDGGNQLASVDDKKVPRLCRTEVAGQSRQGALPVNLGMSKAVRANKVVHQSYKAVHVFAGADACAFTVVGSSRFNFFLPGVFEVSPKGAYGLASLTFIIDKIKCHLLPISSQYCSPPATPRPGSCARCAVQRKGISPLDKCKSKWYLIVKFPASRSAEIDWSLHHLRAGLKSEREEERLGPKKGKNLKHVEK